MTGEQAPKLECPSARTLDSLSFSFQYRRLIKSFRWIPDIKCSRARLHPNGTPKYDVVDLLRDGRRLVLLTRVQARPRPARQGHHALAPLQPPDDVVRKRMSMYIMTFRTMIPHPKFVMLLRAA